MKLRSRHYGIIVLTLTTGFLHLAAAFDKQLFPGGADPLFILNGLGYFVLLGAYFLPMPFFQQKHNMVRLGLISYSILTIVAWIFFWVIQYVIINGTPFFSHVLFTVSPPKLRRSFYFSCFVQIRNNLANVCPEDKA